MVTEKRCPKCGETKPLQEWSKNRSRPDGLQQECRTCHSIRRRASDSRRTATGKSGLTHFIARSGLSRKAARVLWEATRDSEACCSICGIPGHRLAAYERKNAPCPSFHLNHRKMEVDRINPGSMGGEYTTDNVRPLCPKCNFLRGAARRSDHEVRVMMWAAWQRFEDMKHLRWFRNLHAVRGVYTLRNDAESTPGV